MKINTLKIMTVLALLMAVAIFTGLRLPGRGLSIAGDKTMERSETGSDVRRAGMSGQDGHAGNVKGLEAGHEEARVIRLKPDQVASLGIELIEAGPGDIENHAELPGVIGLNEDRLSHVVPRVPGIVTSVKKFVGDRVKAGDIMAILNSRELAELTSAYLAARERVSLAKIVYQREKGLWQKQISAELEFLEAKKSMKEALIEERGAERKLHTIGFDETRLNSLTSIRHADYARYEIVAPLDGIVIEKHITLGEAVKDEKSVFVVADMSKVWGNLRAYSKDIPNIKLNQSVEIETEQKGLTSRGRVDYISPILDESTRTALIRVVLPNPDGKLRPGLFVTGRISVNRRSYPVTIPFSAVLEQQNKTIVFVETGPNAFSYREIKISASNGQAAAIESGLASGDRVVTHGGFLLMSEMEKSGLKAGDAH
ncbi:MAG: efflux RND transporter periplasmic adaptor subunit [Deltaproteobacteria bacterium]|nr:efflux RND transporter periplasmic adaptor subunit [Deltaproteobacteria bacterium]